MAYANLDEYFADIKIIRDKLKEFKNTAPSILIAKAISMTKEDFMALGLSDKQAAYELARIAAAVATVNSLSIFDGKSV